MNSRIFLLVIMATGLWLTGPAQAAAPSCQYTSSGNAYCSYYGNVERAYVNSSGWVLLYFDTPLDLSEPAAVGIGDVTHTVAAIIPGSADSFFKQSFYATILTAQARGANVRVQMRGTYDGYLILDRVWVYE